MMTEHKFHIGSSCDMQELEDNSIELVVTSPPYPMIEMWGFSETKNILWKRTNSIISYGDTISLN